MTTLTYPPGPKEWPVLGSSLAFRRKPLELLTKLAGEFGDVTHFKIGPYHVYLLNHPDYLKEVLVTQAKNFHKGRSAKWAKPLLGEGLIVSEDAFHLRQRRLIQPLFHKQRIAAYGTVMADYADQTSQRWQERLKRAESLDIAHEMMELTLRIVAKTIFDADVEAEAKEIGAAVTAGMEWWHNFLLPLGQQLNRLPLPSTRRFEKALARLDEVIFQMIKERRGETTGRGDLLSLLMRSQELENDCSCMTDRQARDEAVNIMLAGHETTATALTWAWYALSEQPEIEHKLHAELDRVLAGRLPTVEDLPLLPYTEKVWSETLRAYPPIWAVSRLAIRDCEIGGYVIPANSTVILSQWVMHHDQRYYPEPYKFDPERWTPGAKTTRPRFSFFPFGGGNRLCIGESFAWLEGILLLAALAQGWQMRPAPGYKVEFHPLITLRPKGGMWMTLHRR